MTPPSLPRLVVLTDRLAAARRARTLMETVREAINGGARAVLLREKDLPVAERRALLEMLCSMLEAVGGRAGVASDAELAASAGIDWVHLAQADEFPVQLPTGGPSSALIGRSCHSVAEAIYARSEGCGYMTVSPVAITLSKLGYGPALDADGLQEICAAVAPVKVWALGGVTEGNAARWLTAGAHGIAVMGGIMGAADPSEATASYLRLIGGAT